MPRPYVEPRRLTANRVRITGGSGLASIIAARLRRGERPGGEAGEAVPVEPNRPLDLSGGAAAALEFDD